MVYKSMHQFQCKSQSPESSISMQPFRACTRPHVGAGGTGALPGDYYFRLPSLLKLFIGEASFVSPSRCAWVWLCGQVGPELEIPGYGCEDHFLEQDTIEHSWECVLVRCAGRCPRT